MERLARILEIHAPLAHVYQHWRRAEEFPRFARSLARVTRTGSSHYSFESRRVGGKRLRWAAVVTEDVPDTRIRWQSTSGDISLAGLAEFIPAEGGCVVLVVLEYRPPLGIIGRAGSLLLDVEGLLEDELLNLSAHIETSYQRLEASPAPPALPVDEGLTPAAAASP